MPKKGFKHSVEHNQKISIACSGRLEGFKHSESMKQKLSAAHLGKPSPFKGRQHSFDSKLKISFALVGREQSQRIWAPSTKRHYGKSGYHNGILYQSSYELKFMQLLDEYKIPYERADIVQFRVQYLFHDRIHYYYPDFYLPREGSIVEVKSLYQLNSEGTQIKLNAAKEKYGDRFFVLTEEELF